MKKIVLLILGIVLFTSCNNGNSKGKRIVSASSGNINNLSVVVDNNLWEGNIGESIRSIFGAEVYGLPQQEPLFTLRQMPTSVFSGFAAKNRTVLKIEKGKAPDVKILENPLAKPQRLAVITGNTNAEIIEQMEQNSKKIIAAFKDLEVKEKQRRTTKSLSKDKSIEEQLGITLKFPSAYRIAKNEDGFFWLRRDIKNGDVNFVVYEMPIDAISEGDNAITDIIKMRDSIGKVHIPGPLEDSYMITEEAYTPFLNKTIIDNKPAFETRSTWEVKGAFMAGPFLNYVIKDEINKRLIILEGFVFAPSTAKRDYIFELEAIMKSIKVK